MLAPGGDIRRAAEVVVRRKRVDGRRVNLRTAFGAQVVSSRACAGRALEDRARARSSEVVAFVGPPTQLAGFDLAAGDPGRDDPARWL
jgi:hypothetical protein